MSYIKQRSVVGVIFLSLVTCGLYPIYLFFVFGTELQLETDKQNVGITLTNPLFALVLTFVTCGIYGLYYVYKQALAIELIGNKYNYRSTSAIVVLFFTFFFGIGAYINIYNASNVSRAINNNKIFTIIG